MSSAVCIVTGSATGIGAACAIELARRGWRTVINFTKSEAEAQQTAAECEKAGGETLLVRANVAEDADCRRMADAALEKWGRIDGLINNAGTTKVVFNHADLNALSAADFQSIYAVNVIGAFQMIRAARAQLEAGAKASGVPSAVVNVSSVAGISGGGSSVAYAASKGALNTMTQSLARALAPLIRVNTVCPGYIDTPWFTKGRGEAGAKQVRDSVIARVPLKSASTAEDIAQLVCFLALPQSGQMTGEFVRMDAGMHLIQ